jgi:hypothetical protein
MEKYERFKTGLEWIYWSLLAEGPPLPAMQE